MTDPKLEALKSEMAEKGIPEDSKLTNVATFMSYNNRCLKDYWRWHFLEYNDPTGWVFAERWVEGGFRRWRSLRNSELIKKEFEEWEDALEMKLRSQAIVTIATQRESFQANKWLADRGWVDLSAKRKKDQKKKDDAFDVLIKDDMERLGLTGVEAKPH